MDVTVQSKPQAEKVSLASADVVDERLQQLRALYPEAFAEDRVDLERLAAALGDVAESQRERYGLSWAGKAESIKAIQSRSVGTLKPDRDRSINFDTTANLFIEGDNLEVLKLLQRSYHSRVKMIYIDPPYNTGKEFIYPDNYAEGLRDYLQFSKQVGEGGARLGSNADTSGRYHSKWLSMIYPRLFLARQLLMDEGVLWVSIDDNEAHNLRAACNEVFGEENCVATFLWEKRTTRENRKVFSINHDYILCFAKDKTLFQASRRLLPLSDEVLARYENPDNDPRGDWQSVSLNAQAGPGRRKEQFYDFTTPSGRLVKLPSGRCWTVTIDRMQELIADNRVWFGEDGDNVPREKIFLSEAKQGLTPHTLWKAEEVGTTDSAKKDLIQLFEGLEVYDTPKPLGVLDRLLEISTSKDQRDIVVDFFGGSGTTGHAVMNANKDGGNRQLSYDQKLWMTTRQ